MRASFVHIPTTAWPGVCACAGAVMDFPHNDGTNIAYLDGHVKWLKDGNVYKNAKVWCNLP